MKTKTVVTWEERDIQSGRYIIRQSCPEDTSNISFAASVTYKIGFVSAIRNNRCLISICDGMVLMFTDKKELAEHLNNDEIGFRLLTQEELITQIAYLRDQNEGSS